MENKSHALAAGSFVLLLLALLVALAVWLTRDTGRRQVYEISSAEAVTGLQPQASVRFKGVIVGKVTAIGFDPVEGGHVLIRIAIDEKAPITTSTFATLGFQGITGLAFVQLDDTGKSQVSLPASEDPPRRIPMQPGLISKLSGQSERMLAQLEETTRRLNLLLGADNQKTLMRTIDDFGQAATSINQLSAQAGKVLPQLAQDTSATLKTMQTASARVGDGAEEARALARSLRLATERVNAPGGTLDQLSLGIDTLVTSGAKLNASTWPRLNQTLDDAARSARSLSRVADRINDNPQSLLLGNRPAQPGPGEPGFSARP